jgi:hypothetical protein
MTEAQQLAYGKRVLLNCSRMAAKAAELTDIKRMQQRAEEVGDMGVDVGKRLLKFIKDQRAGK